MIEQGVECSIHPSNKSHPLWQSLPAVYVYLSASNTAFGYEEICCYSNNVW